MAGRLKANLQLIENGPGVRAELEADGVEALLREGDRWRKQLRLREAPLSAYAFSGGHTLTARGVLGCASVGDINIDIAPKFVENEGGAEVWGPAMWHWIAYASGMNMAHLWTSGGVGGSGIADLMADAFLTALDTGIRHGLPVQYASRSTESPYLSGRLALNRLTDPTAMNGRLPVVERTLTRKTAEARLLRWAAESLASVVRSASRRVRLLEMARRFPAQRASLDMGVDVERSARQFPHLVPALQLAMLLLSGRTLGPAGARVRLPGFLCASEVVFEKALLRLVGEAGGKCGLRASKDQFLLAKPDGTYGGRADLSTTPDVAVRRPGGGYVTMLDAKYRVENGSPTSSEAYQVIAAGRVAHTHTVALVYPRWAIGIEEHSYRVVGTSRPFRLFSLSLGMKCFESQARLSQTVDLMTAWLRLRLVDVEPSA